ncbi:MAG: hypothetical protein WC648_03040 [Candidatus Paceibacterota bacterium]|jgi:uncharacterized membrane protein YphA (DoxX/SURF4 family)
MTSVFPSLLSWSELSPFLIRIVLGITFLFFAYKTFRQANVTIPRKTLATAQMLAGLLLVIGLWSQVAALFIIIYLIVLIVGKIRNRAFLTDGINYYLLLLVMAISILVTGAGLFGFDYRL